MIKKFFAFMFLFFLVSESFAACSVFFENTYSTCSPVHSVTETGVTNFISQIKSQRASNIEAPTRDLAVLHEKYNYITSYYDSIVNIVNALTMKVAMTQKEIEFLGNKEFEIKKTRSDLEILRSEIDMLSQEIDLVMSNK